MNVFQLAKHRPQDHLIQPTLVDTVRRLPLGIPPANLAGPTQLPTYLGTLVLVPALLLMTWAVTVC